MKKLLSVLLILTMCAGVFTACKKDEEKTDTEVDTEVAVNEEEVELSPEMLESLRPQEIQVRNICQLATLEVYFHNVAKAVKPASTSFFALTQQDRRFWIEYSGTATIGIDMSRVTMEIEDNVITVRIPHAQMIGGIDVDSDSYDINSVVVESEDWWRAKNEITADDVTNAIREANTYTTLSLLNNRSMMLNAELRATDLIEKYIEQVSMYSDTQYTVNFEYIEDQPAA